MGKWNRFSSRIATIRQLFRFLWKERLWWMIPLIVMLLFFGLLIAVAQQSALAPFIYTLI